MIDFHNHVLHEVDDGPKTIEESIDMLKSAYNQGIKDVVQTVHFQHPKMHNKNTNYQYLKQKIIELQKIIDNEGLGINLHLSAEVFYLPNLKNLISNPLVTFGKGKYMLIEFSTNIYPTGYEEEFYKLQLSGITPIIAHPERYRFIQNDIDILNMWQERGFVIQIDAGSIIGQFGMNTKKNALEMVEKGYVHIIGSDSHNSKKRNFCLNDAYSFLNSRFSDTVVNQLKHNINSIMNGEKVKQIDFGHIGHNKKAVKFMDKIIKLMRR